MLLAELGSAFLLASLVLVAVSGATGLVAGRRGDGPLAAVARRAFYAAAVGLAGASATLLVALLGRDFSIAYVFEHTDRSLSLSLTAAAFYGGQEGSLLYWGLLLALMGSASLAAGVAASVRMTAFATAVLSGILGFFVLVMVFVASPFALLPVAPTDGLGLNPLLRDGGMLIHPPFLLAGYSAFAVPFAFAIAALLAGRDDAAWVAHTRRYALVAWGLQSVGLTLGMWWAYHVLGWGGYWGWDPVENAALMPWLATTAYIHSAQVQERRGSLRAWNFGLVIAAFLLSALGTFLVRSGVLPSVHSFAVSPLGPWFFGFLVAATAVSGAVLAGRSERLRSPAAVEPGASREGAFLLQNVLLVALTGAVLWGTVLPLVSGMTGRELVVGAPYYERVATPLLVAVLALLAVGPALPWRRVRGGWPRLLRWPLAAWAVALAGLLAAGVRQPGALLALPLVAAGLATCAAEYWRGAAFATRLDGSWPRAAARVAARNRRRYGAYLAHAGMLAVAAGLIGSHVWQQTRQVTLQPGQSVTVGSHTLTYDGVAQRSEGDHSGLVARVRMGDETLEPARFVYPSLGGQAVTTAAIRSTPFEDVYVVLGGADASGAAFTVYVNPLVTWIWVGGALLVVGVLLGNLVRPAPQVERAKAGAAAPVVAR
ncbi:MAG TPA: cytochrome c-type biogenesis CcmF C-terminal domain-containing protein [Candidatus Dormibacteraeota bacterium]|nr:cytochrome c-type biogenesis CcmF C-terminal domain-containing protein [Candidatus Dormibacteraeota bacterium]